MKRFLFLALLPLASCADPAAPPPGTAAPTAIQQARLRCEGGYKLSRSLGELGVTAGVVKGEMATRAAALDKMLYDALGLCRAAFRSGDTAATVRAADRIDTLADQLAKGTGQ